MNYLKIILLCVLTCYGLTLSAQSFSLNEAIEYALINHNDIKLKLLDQSDADVQVKEYWAKGLPQVNGNIRYQYFFEIPIAVFGSGAQQMEIPIGTKNNLAAGLSASALLFDGGFLVGLKAQRAYKELVDSQIGETERDIRVNVTKAYLNVLALNESLRIIEENITFLGKTRDEAQALYENGFAEQLDVDRLNLTIQNLTADVDNLQQVIHSTKVVLKFQMGYPMANDIDLSDDLDKMLILKPVTDNFEIEDYSIDNRVELGLLDQSVGLADINIKSIKAQYLPSLTASVDYSQSLQTNQLFGSSTKWFPTGIVGLNLGIPIYDGGDKKAKIARAKIQREELLLQRDGVERLIQMEIQTSKISVENAKRSLKQREASQALAEKIYNTTLIKYKEGVGSSLEINQAEIDMLAAQRNYIDSLFDYLLARTELERALGNL